MIYVFIGIAGALGAISRYSIGLLLFPIITFPYVTLFINLAGCYLLASILSSNKTIPENWRLAIGTGFLGSFTTFSTLSLETVQLVDSGEVVQGILYILLSILGGIVVSRLGWRAQQ